MTTEIIQARSTDLITLNPQEYVGLPASKAEQIRATFLPMADMLEAFEGDYNEVMTLAAAEVTPEVSARARRLRLDIAKVRIAASKAAKAPVRKRLTAWVETFALPDLPGEEHEKAAEIRERFRAFQAWAQKEVESI